MSATWTVSVGGALWTRTLASGQLAAIWSYTEPSGTYYKLLTDRDRGDYSSLANAMAVAAFIETGQYRPPASFAAQASAVAR